MKLNFATIQALLKVASDDSVLRKVMQDALSSFELYHQAIYQMETWLLSMPQTWMDGDAYREQRQQMDHARTAMHEQVLINLNILNRVAEKNHLSPVYTGIVSKEQPYRREAANSVLCFVQEVVESRL